MKIIAWLCAPCLVLVLASAAFADASPSPAPATTLSGKYVGESNSDSWFIFKADGTVTLREGGREMSGTYKLDGDKLTLTISDVTVQAKVSGDEILPAEGGKGQPMKKQKE